jgi:hypothetical protein
MQDCFCALTCCKVWAFAPCCTVCRCLIDRIFGACAVLAWCLPHWLWLAPDCMSVCSYKHCWQQLLLGDIPTHKILLGAWPNVQSMFLLMLRSRLGHLGGCRSRLRMLAVVNLCLWSYLRLPLL